MKLLEPTAIKDLKGQESARELLRSQEIQKIADKTRKELANSQADFYNTLAKQKEIWVKEEEEHSQRVKERQQEIQTLEAKKLSLMVPFTVLKEGTEKKVKDAENFLKDLKEKEQRVEELTERLEDKLDKTGEKEQDLKQWEQRLIIKQQGIDQQFKNTADSAKQLTAEIASFTADKQKADQEINQRKTELALIEQTLIAKRDSLLRTESSLNDLAKQLQDEREVLKRAFEEVKRMRG